VWRRGFEVIMDIHVEAEWKRMGETIRKTVESEGLEVLGKLVPRVHRLIGEKKDDETSSTAHNVPRRLNGTETLNRLTFALLSFLRTVSTSSYPIILFLDDLQWADEASLDLIRSIVSDTKLRHLLLVGAIREEEVDEVSHPLAIMMKNLDKKKAMRPITRIRLDNLDVATISELIFSLLRLEVPDVAELSEFAHQRTGCNAFFVCQFLRMLQERDLLTNNMSMCKWTWNIASQNKR
jgi:predicted ATPase